MDSITRKKLIENLPDSWIDKLKAEFEYSEAHIRKIVRYGTRKNNAVLDRAIELAAEESQKKRERIEKINSLSNAN